MPVRCNLKRLHWSIYFRSYQRPWFQTLSSPMMYWILLLIVPILLGVYAQIRVSSAYHKNLKIASRGGITGAEAAQAVMSSAGVNDVEIVEVEGQLSDHYDP